MLRVAHLHDDQSTGEVARYLAFLATEPELARSAEHRAVSASRFFAGATPVEADVIVSHLPLSWRGLPGLMALRARNPRATLVHVEHRFCEGHAANARHRRRLRALVRASYALFDQVIAVSAAQARWMRRHALVPAGQLSVIPPCVDLAAISASAAPTGPVRRISAIGRLHRQNGFDILIEAFGSVSDPDARLDIYGDGPQRAELRALARLDPRIRLHGNTARLSALRLSDVIAIPSRWQPYGLVAQEAQAGGRRVLHSGRDGLADLTGAGTVAVADLSVAAWSRALSDALAATDPAPRIAPEFPRDLTVQGWQALLDRVASRQKNGRSAFATV